MITLNSSEMLVIIIFTAVFVIYTFTSISILNEENKEIKKRIIELKRHLDTKEQDEYLRNLEERRRIFLELKNKDGKYDDNK